MCENFVFEFKVLCRCYPYSCINVLPKPRNKIMKLYLPKGVVKSVAKFTSAERSLVKSIVATLSIKKDIRR